MGEDKIKRQNRLLVLASVQGHDSSVAHAFNHSEGMCPKCGYGEHMLMFCLPGQSTLPRLRGCELEGEHIHRICGACKYPWIERPLDQTLLCLEEGEVLVESELAAALAAIAHQANGITMDRTKTTSYRGWTLKFHRNPQKDTLLITTHQPKRDIGKPTHPDINDLMPPTE